MWNRLSDDAGIDKTIVWCKNTGVTRVFLESYRDGYIPREPSWESDTKTDVAVYIGSQTQTGDFAFSRADPTDTRNSQSRVW